MHIIAADVGGTKTRLAFADAQCADSILYETRYKSGEFDDFESMLHTFIQDCEAAGVLTDMSSIEVLMLALPGLVSGSSARLTNLPWVIEKTVLQETFGIKNVSFMNDFQASAFGIAHLLEKDKIVLHAGVWRSAKNTTDSVSNTQLHDRRLAVGAGTGLGVSWVEREHGDDKKTGGAHASEGGHIDFAPVNEIQMQLLNFLQQCFGRVSYERILSGDGLVSLYQFCADRQGRHTQRVNINDDDINAEWVNSQANNDAVAASAVSLFVQIYGAYIGNLALLFKPDGGIFITGGIAAKMVSRMQSDEFINAYLDKGRMRVLVEQFAVHLVINERIGVLGALSQATKKAK